jgi:hypothetical protein
MKKNRISKYMLYSIDEIVIGELGTSITIGLNTNLYKPLKIYTV